ncbi:hypothetical protein ALO_01300 [Acetonema longum DSM 6540]|uniref:Uncharacterized protein n=1 Tax=Acetonema longum DSM 6540 TaxID=1009370 RepID=F7NDZ8_9FIRM|nr:hypothetical protein ALO_01300 [Acetonema longum DSM 6540]
MNIARNDLLKNGISSWDVDCGTQVKHGPLNRMRYIGIFIFILGWLQILIRHAALNAAM